MSYMQTPINPANRGTYCDKDKHHDKKKQNKKTKTEQQLFYPDSWQASEILSILNWHGCVMCQYPVSYLAFPEATKCNTFFHPVRSCYILGLRKLLINLSECFGRSSFVKISAPYILH